MSLIGHDKSGPRIQCTANKEGQSCPNGARYYVRKIETMVIHRLTEDLSDPRRIASYVQGYLTDRRARVMKARRDKSSTENRLATERMRYNELVRDYNAQRARFPSNITAKMFKFKEYPYWEVPAEARQVPKVTFQK